jgi:hypothetical protein
MHLLPGLEIQSNLKMGLHFEVENGIVPNLFNLGIDLSIH